MGTYSPLEGVNRFAPDGGGTAGRLSLDDAFAVLARPESRAVLAVLAPVEGVDDAADRPVEAVVDDVAAQVDVPRGQVAAALHHVYIPRLDGAGLVVHDREADTVAPGPHLAAVRPLLELAQDRGE